MMSDIQLNLTHGPESTRELKIRHRGNRVNNTCLYWEIGLSVQSCNDWHEVPLTITNMG